METTTNIRPEVLAFASLMEKVLQENDHKKGWKQDPIYTLFNRFLEEAKELNIEYEKWLNMEVFDKEKFIKEALDVANFLMMMIDNINSKTSQTK